MKNIRTSIPRRSKRLRCAALLLAGLTAALLCGCSSNKAAAPTETPEATPESTQASAPVSGGVLAVSIPANVASFDPLTAYSKELQNLLSLVYLSLIHI